MLILAISTAYSYGNRFAENAARALSSSEHVVSTASADTIKLALAVCFNAHGVLSVCTAVLHACGHERRATTVHFVASWLLGTSVGALLGFGKLQWQSMGVAGLWLGNALGLSVGALFALLAVGRYIYLDLYCALLK